MNFAAVPTLTKILKNPVIGNRAFGNEPSLVRDFGVQTMKRLQFGESKVLQGINIKTEVCTL